MKSQHALISFILFLLCITSASALQYGIVDLGSITPSDINDAGMIVGSDSTGTAIWDSRTMQRTAVSATRTGNTARMNELNHVVGGRGAWTPQLTELYFTGFGINDLDQIVGYGGRWEYACIRQNGVTTRLEGLPEPAANYATDIDNTGLIVGSSGDKAVTWQNGGISILPVPDGWNADAAVAISDNGIIAGYGRYYTSNVFEDHMMLWINGVFHDAGFIDASGINAPHLYAADVNSSGTVIGNLYNTWTMSSWGAEIWTESTGLIRLDSLLPQGSGWRLDDAYAINNQGQIVGVGRLNGEDHGFLLNPVPEPSGILALGSGLIALGGLIRRRRR